MSISGDGIKLLQGTSGYWRPVDMNRPDVGARVNAIVNQTPVLVLRC